MGRIVKGSAIGVDGYNTAITGAVSMTVTCAASDCHHIPLVITTNPRRKRKMPKGYSQKGCKYGRRCPLNDCSCGID